MRMCKLKEYSWLHHFCIVCTFQLLKLTFAIIPATPPQIIRRVRSVALFAAVLFSFPIALYDLLYREVIQWYQMDVAPLNLFALNFYFECACMFCFLFVIRHTSYVLAVPDIRIMKANWAKFPQHALQKRLRTNKR